MLKGYRAPLALLLIAVVLLGAVLASRQPPPAPPTPDVILVSATAVPFVASPTVIFTPAPTIPIQQIDTTTLKEALIGVPKKLNPLLAGYNQVDRDLDALIYEGLFKTDAYGASVPDLAAAPPDIADDGLTYVVSLRTDVLWQDGQPFSATDVLFTIGLMQDDNFPGPADLRTFWQSVEVDKLDDHTVRFRLAQPVASFLEALRIGILPEHVLRGTPAAQLASHPFNVSPIGTGPYQFDGWIGTSNQIEGIKLRLAATYRQRPEGKTGFALEHLIFRFYPTFDAAVSAFQSGEVFSISELPADTIAKVAALTELRLYFQYRPAFGAVIYNWQNTNTPFFRNLQFRQALARAVDREALGTHFLAGRALPASSPILPDSWAYAADVNCTATNPYDPAAAKTALSVAQSQQIAPPTSTPPPTPAPHATAAATAAADAPTGVAPVVQVAPGSFPFQLLVTNDPALVGMAQQMIQNWKALGLAVQIVVTDPQTFNSRLVKGDFDAALVELSLAPSADPDPYSLWRQPPSDGGLNFGGLNLRQLNTLVETARYTAKNGVERAELYHNYQQVFCDQVPALLLYDPVYVYGADVRISGIQLGFVADASDRFRTIQDWHFSGS